MAYCIYLRKSRSDMEAEAHGEGETLARHEKLLLELAQRGHYTITQIYREIVSGETIAARPVVQHLLQEVEDGKWEGVLVVEVERLARGDTIDQGVMSQAFKYSGTRIITPVKVYDPANEFDEEYFEFGLFMSRREYKTINRRLVRGRVASAKEGKWVSGVAPYGYERVRIKGDKGWTLSPIEAEADIVRFLFRLYTSGEESEDGSVHQVGTYSLALRLDEMGVAPPKSASCWNNQTILAMLQNPVYIGKIRWNVNKSKKKIVNNTVEVEYYKSPAEDVILVDGLHPAIVDEAVFQKAQELLQRSGSPPVPKKDTVRNPLAGILRCGKCGRNIVLRPNQRNDMLYCPNRVCHNVGSKYAIVEERLLQALSEWLSSYRLKWSDKPPAEEQAIIDLKHKSLRKAEAELETLRRQLDRTHDLLEQGVYDTDTFLSRSRSLNDRITAAVADIENLSAEVQEDEQRAACRMNIIPEVEKLLEVYPVLPSAQAKNEMLKGVLEKVEYTKNERSGKYGPFDNFELVLFPKLPLDPQK
ncbi:MAG: recombinase family protein [Ruminococcus sp.]|nr:recombinase family protein [Ruminococcus sp.]